MLQFKHLFANYILTRGLDYYRQGRVTPQMQEDGDYYATVLGTTPYDVEITVAGEKIRRIYCDCIYARRGYKCKHMAAVLYAITDGAFDRIGKPAAPETVTPFQRPADAPYRYFDMGAVGRKLDVYKDDFQTATDLADRGAVLKEFLSGYGTYGRRASVCADVEGEVRQGKDVFRVILELNRDSLGKYSCTCQTTTWPFQPYGRKLPHPCVHTLAVLILADRYIEQYDPGDETDAAGLQLLMNMRRLRQGRERSPDVSVPANTVRLEPTLRCEEDTLSIQIRIGAQKMYILKDLRLLLDAVREKKRLPLGKALQLDFAADTFDSESAALYSLIDQYAAARDMIVGECLPYTYADAPYGREMPLYGSLLDDFFELYAGRALHAKGTVGETLSLRDGTPTLRLTLTPGIHPSGEAVSLRLQGELPAVMDGLKHHYCAANGVLYRLDPDFYASLAPFLSANTFGNVDLTIGRDMLQEFYYTVLPELRRFAEVDEPADDAWTAAIPPQIRYRFYLDAENGVPRCRAQICRGEETYPLTEKTPAARLRDPFGEAQALSAIHKYFSAFDDAAGEYVCADDEDAVFRFLNGGVDELLRIGEVSATDRFNALRVRRRVHISVGTSLKSNLLDLNVSSPDISGEEIAEILLSYRAKKTYHRLKSGEFVPLDETVKQLSALLDAMQISVKDFTKGKMQIPAYRALYLDRMLADSDRMQVTRDRMFRKVLKDFATVKDADFEPPTSLSGTLRGYQVYGYKWLRTLEGLGFHGILADDMGLGKTLQVISVLLAAKEEGSPCRTLVVCPASLVYNWAEELARFAPALSAAVIAGTGPERQALLKKTVDADVLITSYDLLKRDIDAYGPLSFRYQIIDEAQAIKNPSTEAAKSVKLINSEVRFALTGTPIENRLSELWSIFDYLMPGYLYGYEQFRRAFELPIAKNDDAQALARLKTMAAPFILRRLKSEVLKDLPDKLEEVCYARFDPEQQKLYDAAVLRLRGEVGGQDDAAFSKNKLQILAELTRLRRLCCDPALLYEDYKTPGAKRETCMQLVRSAIEGGHKLLLFSQFTSMLRLLEEDLRSQGIPFYLITGSTDKNRRVDLVKAFNNNDVPVFLISLKAGGTGLNLTGADVVIHFDPWWNTAAQQQATDRAHRIGQANVVTVYKLIAKGSIEERILEMQKNKQALADAVLAADTAAVTDLSKEAILQLLS
ncbi:MAG: SNF2 helicase associated domain-containing protein [Clostridia bacterium]|nr:SNF2 helicase associated domain-containing protein [Clostridia bacterium]